MLFSTEGHILVDELLAGAALFRFPIIGGLQKTQTIKVFGKINS